MANGASGSQLVSLASLLDIKALDVDLYRSNDLRRSDGERGIFGGQVISQATVAATRTVDRVFHLHSLHCYFVLNGLASPINYSVNRVRDGRSYSTRAVRAVQDGKTIFIMLCSFQKPEPWQPTYSSPMPDVPSPEKCDMLPVYFRKIAEEQTDDWKKRNYIGKAKFHEECPIETRQASHGLQDGYYVLYLWMRAVSLPAYDAAHQKAVLGYISDFLFLEAGKLALGLHESNEEGTDVSSLTATTSHSIWYYSDDFDCSKWIMFESRVPQAGSGRAIIHRRAFTRDGTLIANCSQEGVVRARVYGPEESLRKVESRM